MERRDFIPLSVADVSAGVVAPVMVLAKSDLQVKSASHIYYTKEDPGRWSGKVATHLPNIEIENAGGKVTVNITTAHEMKGYEHYIVKHVLLDQNYKFIEDNCSIQQGQGGNIKVYATGLQRPDLRVEYV